MFGRSCAPLREEERRRRVGGREVEEVEEASASRGAGSAGQVDKREDGDHPRQKPFRRWLRLSGSSHRKNTETSYVVAVSARPRRMPMHAPSEEIPDSIFLTFFPDHPTEHGKSSAFSFSVKLYTHPFPFPHLQFHFSPGVSTFAPPLFAAHVHDVEVPPVGPAGRALFGLASGLHVQFSMGVAARVPELKQ